VKAREEMHQQLWTMVKHCNGVMAFKQVNNKVSKHVLRKRILSRCHESCTGPEIRLQFGINNIRLALGN